MFFAYLSVNVPRLRLERFNFTRLMYNSKQNLTFVWRAEMCGVHIILLLSFDENDIKCILSILL